MTTGASAFVLLSQQRHAVLVRAEEEVDMNAVQLFCTVCAYLLFHVLMAMKKMCNLNRFWLNLGSKVAFCMQLPALQAAKSASSPLPCIFLLSKVDLFICRPEGSVCNFLVEKVKLQSSTRNLKALSDHYKDQDQAVLDALCTPEALHDLCTDSLTPVAIKWLKCIFQKIG